MDNSITLGDFSDSSLRHRSFSVTDHHREQRRRSSHQADHPQQGSSSSNNHLYGSGDIDIHEASFNNSRASGESISHAGGTDPTETATEDELVCKACGFEASFVPEGMLTCDHCGVVHYCSQHCKDWDWKSGGHRRQCVGALQGSGGRNSITSQASVRSQSSVEGDKTEASIEMGELFDKPTRMALMMRAARRAGPGGRPTLAAARSPSRGSGSTGIVRRLSATALQPGKDFRKEKPESTTTGNATTRSSSARGSPGSAMRAPEGQLGAFLNRKSPENKTPTSVNSNHSGGVSVPFSMMENDDSTENKSDSSTTDHPSFASVGNNDEADDQSISFPVMINNIMDLYASLPCITEENSKMMSSMLSSSSWRQNSPRRLSSKFQASFTSNTSRLIMEDSDIINGGSSHTIGDESNHITRRNNSSPQNSDHTSGRESLLSLQQRQKDDHAYGAGLRTTAGSNLLGDFAHGSMVLDGDTSISIINVDVDERARPNLHDLVTRDTTVSEGKNDRSVVDGSSGQREKDHSKDSQQRHSSSHHDIHEDSILLELDYSDVSSRGESSLHEHISQSKIEEGNHSASVSEQPVKVANEEEDERVENSERTESSVDVYEMNDNNMPYSTPSSPSKASSLKSFREAYNGDSSGTTSPGRDSESSTDCHSLKDFREIYEAEKNDQGSALSHYSGGSASSGKGSNQLQEHLAQLLSNTFDTVSIPNVVDDPDEQDDISLLSSTSPKQWKPQMDKIALGKRSLHTVNSGGLYSADKIESSESESVDERRSLSGSRHKGIGLYSTAQSSGSVSSSESSEKGRKTSGSKSSLKEFRDAYNSDSSSSKSLEQKSESSGSVTQNSSNALKDFRGIYEAGKDEPSVFSYHSDGTNSTGKGSTQLREQLSKLLSNSSQLSQCSVVPLAVDDNSDDVMSMLTTSPNKEDHTNGNSLLNGSSHRDRSQAGNSPISAETGSMAVSRSLLAAKERNESMKESLNKALRVYEEMYGEAAANEVFRKLTSDIDVPFAKKPDRQASGEETFDWKRSPPVLEEFGATDCPPAPVKEPPLTKEEVSSSRFSKYRIGLPSAIEAEKQDESISQESSESQQPADPTTSTAEPSQSSEKPRYTEYRASMTRNDAELAPESLNGSSNPAEGNDESGLDVSTLFGESASSGSEPVFPGKLPQPGYMRYRAKLSNQTQNEYPVDNNSSDFDRLMVEIRKEDISTKPRYMQYRKTLSNSKEATGVKNETTEEEMSESMNESRRSQSSRSVSFLEDTNPLKETRGTPEKTSEMPNLMNDEAAFSISASDDYGLLKGDFESDNFTTKPKVWEVENAAAVSDSNQRYALYRKNLSATKPASEENEKSNASSRSGTSAKSGSASVESSEGQSDSVPQAHYAHYRRSLSFVKQGSVSDENETSSGSSQSIESVAASRSVADAESPLAVPAANVDERGKSGNSSKGSGSVPSRISNADNVDEPFCFVTKPRSSPKRNPLTESKNFTEATSQKSGTSVPSSCKGIKGTNTQEELAASECKPRFAPYKTCVAPVNSHRSGDPGIREPISSQNVATSNMVGPPDTRTKCQYAHAGPSLMDSVLVAENRNSGGSSSNFEAHRPDELSKGESSPRYARYRGCQSESKIAVDESSQVDGRTRESISDSSSDGSVEGPSESKAQCANCITPITASTTVGEESKRSGESAQVPCCLHNGGLRADENDGPCNSESEQNVQPVRTTLEPRYAKYRNTLEYDVDESEKGSTTDSELTSSARTSPPAQQRDENSPTPIYLRYRASLSTNPDPVSISSTDSFSTNSLSSSSGSSIKSETSSALRLPVDDSADDSAGKPRVDPPTRARAWVISSSTQNVDDSDSSTSAIELRYMQYPALPQTKAEGDDSPSSTDWGSASLSCILDKDTAVGHETYTLRRNSAPVTNVSEPVRPKGYKALTKGPLTNEPESKKLDPNISRTENPAKTAEDPPVENFTGSASISLDPMDLWEDDQRGPSQLSRKPSPKPAEKSKGPLGRATEISNASEANAAGEPTKCTSEGGERVMDVRRKSRRTSKISSIRVSSSDAEKVDLLPVSQRNGLMTPAHKPSKTSDTSNFAFDPLQIPTGHEQASKIDNFVDIESGIQAFDLLVEEERKDVAPKKSRCKTLCCFLVGILVVLPLAIGFGIVYAPGRTNDSNTAPDGSTTPDEQTKVSQHPSTDPAPAPNTQPTEEAPTTQEAKLSSLLISGFSKEKIGTKGSPQNLSYEWLVSDPELFSKFTEDQIIRRFALATLYHSTDGPNWENNARWVTDADECEWYTLQQSCFGGVYLSLNLSFNGLSGTIPNEVTLLSDLRELVLAGTSGSPRTIGGILPEELGQMKELRVLDVQGNLLFGRIPANLGELSQLEVLNLSMNRFTLSIPSELKALTLLRRLNLAMNEITGEIPSGINELTKLENLNLGDNNLQGSIGIFGLSLLNTLNLEKNLFTSLDSGIGSLASLEILTIYENNLAGILTTEIGQLRSLKRLNLRSNMLTGTIPSEIGQLQELVNLDLSRNNFSGFIPVEIGFLSNLTKLELQSNHLVGPIPNSLGKLTKAEVIRIDHNDITGAVPTTVCAMFNTFVPVVYLDCSADRVGGPEITCPNEYCCTYCCNDDTQECQCTHEGTFFESLCSNGSNQGNR